MPGTAIPSETELATRFQVSQERAVSRFLECQRVRASADLALRLGLRAGDALMHVRRVLLFGEAPKVLDDIWLPAASFRGLSADLLAQYKGPLYGLFETEFGVRMIRAEEQLRAVAATEGEAPELQVQIGSPLLRVDRLSYSYGDRAIEFRRGHCVTVDFHYWNTLL